MKCFYHEDDDGRCAGYLVNKNDKGHHGIQGREFVAINYGHRFPLETILPDEVVYIVDFSISPREMEQLLDITPNVIWIDHHKTAIDKYKDFKQPIEGLRIDGVAGCMLTYLYLVKKLNQILLPEWGDADLAVWMSGAPKFVRLIADWDTCTDRDNFKYGENTTCFHLGFDAYDFNPESYLWNLLDNKDGKMVTDMLVRGSVIQDYKDTWAKNYLAQFGFEVWFDGLKCFALNLGNAGSDYFKSLPPDLDYDAFIGFAFNGDTFKVSMRSAKPDEVDVSEVCLKYGGGGHRGAAGFNIASLPFSRSYE